jgi:hypothetical protein
MKYCFVVVLLSMNTEALACLCEPVDFREEYNRAAIIATGRVMGWKTKTYRYSLPNGEHVEWTYREYRIRTRAVYKGGRVKTLRVATVWKDAACQMRFTLGRFYLVYALPDKRYGFYTSRCNRNLVRKDPRFVPELEALLAAQP